MDGAAGPVILIVTHRHAMCYNDCVALRVTARGYTTPVRERTVTTSIRVTPSMREQLRRIARHERRTTNNWIRNVLEDAIARYFEEHPEVPNIDDEQAESPR